MQVSEHLKFPWKLVWYTINYAITGQPSLAVNVDTQPATPLTTSIIWTNGHNTAQLVL